MMRHPNMPPPAPLAMRSELVHQTLLVRDPTGRSALHGAFVATEWHTLAGTVLGWVLRLGGGVSLRITPDWVVEEQQDRPDNVVAFRPRGAR